MLNNYYTSYQGILFDLLNDHEVKLCYKPQVRLLIETCGHLNIIDQRNERPEVARSHHTFRQYKPTNIGGGLIARSCHDKAACFRAGSNCPRLL